MPVPDAMAAAIDERTVLVVASAPSYAHGVVDPVTEIAAAAAARGVRCHVDACIGGWVLPYAARLGRPVPPWTFAVEGVTSISVDLHKYAYAPKGTSILLHRTPELRRPQFFASARWPGYTMLNPTMQSTKSGGPLAGAWAVVNTIGDAGLSRPDREGARRGRPARRRDLAGSTALRVVVRPDSTLVAFATDATCDVFTITDAMTRAGWYVQPQLSFEGREPTIHLSLSAATADHVDEFLEALAAAVAARGRGRARSRSTRRSWSSCGASTRPRSATTTSTACSPRSAWPAGTAEVGLPESMAEINALLDLATPALREALLSAFLDRLLRPAPYRA